jgi:glycosyltransferase involved in cell wall biosynthesis
VIETPVSSPVRTNRKRLAIFHTHLRIGGVERVLVNLIRELHDRGYEIDLLLVSEDGEFRSEIPAGVRTVELKPATGPGVGIFASVLPLTRYLRKARPDTVLAVKPHTNIVTLLSRRLAMTPTRAVISRHSMTSHQLRHLDNVKHRMIVRLSKYAYSDADAIVTVSKGVREDVSDALGIPADRLSVIYNPIVTPELLRKSDQPVDHPWFAEESPPVILSVGRLHPQKNYSGLIEAFATVRTEVDARLMILGEGESRAELEQRSEELGLADEVALPGSTENPYAYMRRASVLVVSSFTEALPSALIEAMACGCPVVSTNCSSGPVEILQDGEYGRLVPVNDPDALAEGIVSTLRDPPPPSKLEDRAMDFSAETITDEYERTLFPE